MNDKSDGNEADLFARLRRAQPGDAPAIAACVDAAYRRYIERIGKPPGPMMDNYDEIVRDCQVWIIPDETGGCLAALVLIPHADHLLVDNIAVHPAAQGNGLGRRLMAFADEEARLQRLTEIRLYTHQKMIENVEIYKRLGYEETGRGFEDGYDRVFMRKRLA
jgi:ribosomal protein S18 acetylase RimI-like enzyme